MQCITLQMIRCAKVIFVLGSLFPVFMCGLTQEDIRTQALEHYDIKVPPLTEGPVVVYMGMTLNYFTLEETEHVFLANAWIRLAWKDPRLAWNANNTNGSFLLRYADHEIWQPDITLYNNAYPTEIDHYGDTHVLVSSDGTVLWVPPARLAAHCSLNLIRWPFDTHICVLKFGSWTHSGAEIDLNFYQVMNETEDQLIEHQLFVKNSEWNLIKTNVTKNYVTYKCCVEPYMDITFSFHLQRSSPSYSVSVVLPIIIISLVNIMVFLLPPTAGEKIILGSINSFIICVFLIYFQAKLPPLGDHLPLLVLLYACNLVLVGISIVISVTVLNLSRNRRASSPPQCFRMFCNASFAQLLGLGHIVPFVSSTHTRLDEGVEMRSPHENHRHRLDINGEKEEQLTSLVDYESPYMGNAEWILLAAMVDRLSLIVYAIVSGIVMGLCLA